jgi:hypothetical protein
LIFNSFNIEFYHEKIITNFNRREFTKTCLACTENFGLLGLEGEDLLEGKQDALRISLHEQLLAG